MEWTKAQQSAIQTRGNTVLISAGAGSGKTAVLTERIMSLLHEGVSLDQLLVVTFTKAAAAEMRERILKSLHEAASAGDPTRCAQLSAQAMRIERADITTLHGFCAKICREYFEAVSIDPMFRVADEAETGLLQERALMEALLQCFESPTKAFAYAAECLTQEQLADVVLQLYHALMAQPDPWGWLDDAINGYTCSKEELQHSKWVDTLLHSAAMDVQRALLLYESLLNETDSNPKYKTYVLGESAYCMLLRDTIASGISACATLPEKPATRKPTRPKDADAAFEDWFASVNKKAREHIKEASDLIDWLLPIENRKKALQKASLMLDGIAQATRAFDGIFCRIKSERNVLSYHDLEHCALKALQQESIAASVRAQYHHVFIDEYQDTSNLQEEIIKLVSRPDTLFMVGDVKQSIYRFRLSEPSLFINKMNAFARGIPQCENIFLSENFRSHPMLLDCINDVFADVFCGGPMEIDYKEEARLFSGQEPTWNGARVELHVITQAMEADKGQGAALKDSDTYRLSSQENAEGLESEYDTESDDDAYAEKASIRQEAQLMAERIIALRNAEDQKYKLRDMAILLRVIRGKASHIVDVLRHNGIPAKADIGENTLQQVEVQDILSLLRTIDNLHLDIPLIASLRGPALGLSAEEIASIRIARPEGTFAEAVLAYCERDDPLSSALRQFLQCIETWAMQALVCPLDSLIRMIYEQSGAYAIAGAYPDGRQRQDNLCLLAEAAAIFQQQETGGLSGFLRYIDRVQARDGMAATDLGAQEDIVRIMSVHKSKGLQFPVVFVAGLGSSFRFLDAQKLIQIHPTLGIGVHAIDPELRTKQDTIIRKAILIKKRQETLAEQARILYVALTRAQRRLILVGTEKQSSADQTMMYPHDTTCICESNAPSVTDGSAPWRISANDSATTNAPYATSALQWILPAAKNEQRWHVCRRIATEATAEEEQHKHLSLLVEKVRSAALPFPAGKAAIALSWQPPERPVQPLKQSVTARMRMQAEDIALTMEDVPVRPLFMEQQGLTAAARGDAVHAFMRTIPIGETNVINTSKSMVERGILSKEQADSLPVYKLSVFLHSAIWQRISNAAIVHREWPFNLRIEKEGSISLLQGVIDCCFMEQGMWVLLDYKTDHGDADGIMQRYRPQIELYADALSQITGITVKEKILYALTLEKAFVL